MPRHRCNRCKRTYSEQSPWLIRRSLKTTKDGTEPFCPESCKYILFNIGTSLQHSPGVCVERVLFAHKERDSWQEDTCPSCLPSSWRWYPPLECQASVGQIPPPGPDICPSCSGIMCRLRLRQHPPTRQLSRRHRQTLQRPRPRPQTP